ncbi:zinc-binding dehydrogenase [Chloroflexota bacterium]
MKAVAKTKPEVGIEIIDIPEPKIKPHEALVQIEYCGICGTDVGFYEWRESERFRRGKPIPLPAIIGHEPAGVVVEVGAEVKNVKPGDRVASDSWGGCCHCYWCRLGHFNQCLYPQNLGSLTHGAMAKYCAIPFIDLYKVPDSMSFEEAAMLQPLGVGVRGAESLVYFKPGDDVVVMGCGPVGMLVALVMQAAGAGKLIITGLGIDAKRLEMARQLGFTTINADEEPVRDVVLEMTGGLGADVVFDATSKGNPGQGLSLVKVVGQLAIAASVEGSPELDWKCFRKGEIIINTFHGRNPSTWKRSISLVGSGRVNVKPLITHKVKIEDAEKGFQMLIKREGMKVLIEP